MGDKIDILKIILDFLKGNKLVWLWLAAALGIGGNIYQAMPKTEPKIEAVETPKAAIVECGCMSEIKKLKRWHE